LKYFYCKNEKITAMKLDSIDKAILRNLQEDAHLTTKELSNRLNLSPTPVYERVRRLEKEELLKDMWRW
jgi:DNA-binding Lrp family transcriptional regulator